MKTREIRPNQDFKHETKTYKKGRKYNVSLEDAKYFMSAGWVGEQSETGKDQSLAIDDIYEGHEAEVN